jgi:PIN domain nuclease of toxin-antitoxin system
VSLTSAHEIQVKHQRDPAAFPFSLRHMEAAMREFACTELPVSFQDLQKLDQLQFLHKDPFDRILMAQAARRDLLLLTADQDILATGHQFRQFRVFK